MKVKYIQAHMAVAETYAQLSTAKRLQVGAIVVKDNRVISIGYNGMPAGWDNDCEYTEFMPVNDPTAKFQDYPFLGTFWINGHNVDRSYRLRTKPEVLHAETNAIAKLARSNESGADAVMFITHAPCLDCAKLIYQTGISKVYYRNQYRNTDGVEFLKKGNVEVTQI